MDLQSVREIKGDKLYGDLSSLPNPARRLRTSDILGLEAARPYAGLETATLDLLITEMTSLTSAELGQVDHVFDHALKSAMGPQFRSRPDLQRCKIAIEQWIPALDCWMVNGYFEPGTYVDKVIETLRKGDPRFKTAEQIITERREAAAKVRAANEEAGNQRVLAAIDGMSTRQVKEFVEVEQALQTGEEIHFHGSDIDTLDSLQDQTRIAAYKGDREAQHVMIRGQKDNKTCALPTTNPLRHRHRSELEGAK